MGWREGPTQLCPCTQCSMWTLTPKEEPGPRSLASDVFFPKRGGKSGGARKAPRGCTGFSCPEGPGMLP